MKTTKAQENIPEIHFKTKLVKIGSWTIVKLDKSSSSKLSTRGLAMVEGTINGFRFQTALEPDGKGSHWFKIDTSMREDIGIDIGDAVELVIRQTKEWSEPKVPEDLKTALITHSEANAIWLDITPLSRWEWIRWINSTKQLETRKLRIEKTLGKLKGGHRRPCCFNVNQCTVPDVSNNGILLEPN